MPKEMITITKEKYDTLKADQDILYKLYAAGVDNWEWYGEALFGDEQEDEEDE